MAIITTHLPYMEEDKHLFSYRDLNIGDIITFDYKLKERYVLVLNRDYQDKLHGLSLEMIGRGDLLPLMHELFLTRDPKTFYSRIDDIVKKTDAYRSYNLPEISNIILYKYQR